MQSLAKSSFVRCLLGNSSSNGAAIVDSATRILNCRLATIKTDHLSLGEMGD